MALIGLLLAVGTVAILGYAGYTLYRERRGAAEKVIAPMPVLAKYAAADEPETKQPALIPTNGFIDFVAAKFNKEEYNTHLKGTGATPPDLLVKLVDNPSVQFAVACYHSNSFSPTNPLEISAGLIESYYRYHHDNNHTVFVIIGAGGTILKPEKLYVVPLYDIPLKQPQLLSSYLSRYRKLDMTSNFFLLPERMILI